MAEAAGLVEAVLAGAFLGAGCLEAVGFFLEDVLIPLGSHKHNFYCAYRNLYHKESIFGYIFQGVSCLKAMDNEKPLFDNEG
ncbi:MAG: hypothetical protein PHX43_08920 [Alphaproteobacteria bacterium]|nr:hypothetical protein [Alphaproteobacteria bacterium]